MTFRRRDEVGQRAREGERERDGWENTREENRLNKKDCNIIGRKERELWGKGRGNEDREK